MSGGTKFSIMKRTLLIIVLAAILAASYSFAQTGNDSARAEPEHELPAYEFVEYITLPKPTRGPMPKAQRELVGMKFSLQFTVTEDGEVENVRLEKPLASYSDIKRMTFANQALEAVARWQFKPARDANDNPVEANVIMPIKVVKYGKIYRALASIDFDDSAAKL